MNFKVAKDVLDAYEDPYLEVTRNGKRYTISSYSESGDDYVFAFKNIAPQTMKDATQAVLYATKDGKLYGSGAVSTTVKDYAHAILNAYSTEKDGKLRTLMVDLLNYGAAAQTYHNYKADSLANAELTEEQKTWASTGNLTLENITDTAYETVADPEVTWKAASLILDNAVTIRYKFAAEDVTELTLKVKYNDKELEYDESFFEANSDGTYSFKFSKLFANQMSVPVYATFYKGDRPVSNTLAYNVESYAAQVQQSMPGSALENLTEKMMRYGMSAESYAK